MVGVSGAITLAAGFSHTCAVVAGGALKCWGLNSRAQLGNGTTNNSTTAVDVIGVIGATSLSAGLGQTCAVVTSGAVKCWGFNNSGQLVNGTFIDSTAPVDVINDSFFSDGFEGT